MREGRGCQTMKKRWYEAKADQFVHLDREELTAAGMFQPVCEMVAGMLRAQVECERLAAEVVEIRNEKRWWPVNVQELAGRDNGPCGVLVEVGMGVLKVQGLIWDRVKVNWLLDSAEMMRVGDKNYMSTVGVAKVIVEFQEWQGFFILRGLYDEMKRNIEKRKGGKN